MKRYCNSLLYDFYRFFFKSKMKFVDNHGNVSGHATIMGFFFWVEYN